MTILGKVIAIVTPPESHGERDRARAKTRDASRASPWLERVLKHHQQIESAFAAVKAAGDANGRRHAQKWLATLLTGHSPAEEAVPYPAMRRPMRPLRIPSSAAPTLRHWMGIAAWRDMQCGRRPPLAGELP